MDLSQYSDAELEDMLTQEVPQGQGGDLSGYSDDELMAMLPKEAPKNNNMESFGRGFQDMTSFGLDDELRGFGRAAGTKIRGDERPFTELYDLGREEVRLEHAQAKEDNPNFYMGGQIVGGIASSVAPAKALSSVEKLSKYARSKPIRAAAAVGAVQGGVYGFNSGEGGAGERSKEAAVTGLGGAVAGPIGARAAQMVGGVVDPIAKPLLARAQKVLNKPTPIKSLDDAAENIQSTALKNTPKAETKAASKIKKAIQRDFPDNSEEVYQAWLDGDKALIESYGSQVRTLGQGAAQYKSGKAVAQDYFDDVIAEAPEKMKRAVSENISDVENYTKTVDDILAKGRAKAAPLYDDAYEDIIQDNNILTTPEIQSALKKAYKQFPSELKDAEPNSIKALDYAKRVLDDDIGKAQRAGEGNLARSRTEIKNSLLGVMDESSPSYKAARAQAGDYMKVSNAMEAGKQFMRLDPEDIVKATKNSTEEEKIAFKIGVGKQIRDKIDNKIEGSNPFNAIFGSKTQKDRLAKILTPKEYKNLERGLRAEDRLYKMRNEILGGSPTAGKQQAAADIASGGMDAVQMAASGGIRSVPSNTLLSGLKKMFDGINDDTAEQISRILYETDPAKKLEIISGLSKAKNFTPKQRDIIKKSYFTFIDGVTSQRRLIGASATAPIPNTITPNPETPNYPDAQNDDDYIIEQGSFTKK